MSVKIKHKNPKWTEQLTQRLKEQCNKEVAVGYPTGVKGTDSSHYDNGASIIDVAIWNNFGTETIPRRPFMDNASPKLQKMFKKLCKDTQRKVNEGKISPLTVLKAASLQSEAIVVSEIDATNDPPNSPATIKAKKSSSPLLDSGDMRKYVIGVVRDKTT